MITLVAVLLVVTAVLGVVFRFVILPLYVNLTDAREDLECKEEQYDELTTKYAELVVRFTKLRSQLKEIVVEMLPALNDGHPVQLNWESATPANDPDPGDVH